MVIKIKLCQAVGRAPFIRAHSEHDTIRYICVSVCVWKNYDYRFRLMCRPVTLDVGWFLAMENRLVSYTWMDGCMHHHQHPGSHYYSCNHTQTHTHICRAVDTPDPTNIHTDVTCSIVEDKLKHIRPADGDATFNCTFRSHKRIDLGINVSIASQWTEHNFCVANVKNKKRKSFYIYLYDFLMIHTQCRGEGGDDDDGKDKTFILAVAQASCSTN